MPTPSPNQPPNPPSPSSISTSTCPDDVQAATTRSSRRWPPQTRSSHDVDMNVQSEDEATAGAASTSHGAPSLESSHIEDPESTGAERLLVDEQTSVEPSSRGTTMSPAPRSTATARTSPVPPPLEDDSTKPIASTVDAPMPSIGRAQSTSSRRRTLTPDLARHASVGPSKHDVQAISADPRVDDFIPSLPMGSGYSGSRVSCFGPC